MDNTTDVPPSDSIDMWPILMHNEPSPRYAPLHFNPLHLFIRCLFAAHPLLSPHFPYLTNPHPTPSSSHLILCENTIIAGSFKLVNDTDKDGFVDTVYPDSPVIPVRYQHLDSL